MENTTTKKSLSVEELAEEILRHRASAKGVKLTSKEMQSSIREKGYTFSKDKWNDAIAIADEPPCGSDCNECGDCDAIDDAEIEICDAIDEAEDFAEGAAIEFYKDLRAKSLQDPSCIMSLDACPAAFPEVFRLLDLACEAGLLERVIGYRMTEKALKECKKSAQKK